MKLHVCNANSIYLCAVKVGIINIERPDHRLISGFH